MFDKVTKRLTKYLPNFLHTVRRFFLAIYIYILASSKSTNLILSVVSIEAGQAYLSIHLSIYLSISQNIYIYM